MLNQPYGDCKNDSLHNMGQIQRHGALIAFNASDHTAAFCSENCDQILGLQPEKILGSLGLELFPDNWNQIADLAQKRVIHTLADKNYPAPVDVAVHLQGNYIITEFEPSTNDHAHWWNHGERIEFLERLENTKSISECRRLLVRYLFERTGFHRVMLYEFMSDMHGVVVDERVQPGIDSFSGLHFPADDIPPNAQVFYTKNWQRLIADAEANGVKILGNSTSADKLDLTCSQLRAVHPVHLQYLANMKVITSFSLSIMVKGKLYGLLACHHNAVLSVSLADRRAYEEIARIVSIHLEKLIDLNRQQAMAGLSEQLSQINDVLSNAPAEAGFGVAKHLGLMQELVGASAAWFRHGGEDYFSGPVPQPKALALLRSWLSSLPQNQIYNGSTLPDQLLDNQEVYSKACGILYVPLDENNFVVFLRPEIVQSVTWAGKPDNSPDGSLNPRSSFKAWTEQVRGTSEPWTDLETEFAKKLQRVLLKFVTQPTFE